MTAKSTIDTISKTVRRTMNRAMDVLIPEVEPAPRSHRKPRRAVRRRTATAGQPRARGPRKARTTRPKRAKRSTRKTRRRASGR